MKAKKLVILVAAFALVAAMAVAGTLAYLQATSEAVTNTFIAAELGTVSVAEAASTSYDDKDGSALTNSYLVVPGVGIDKEPKVTFERITADKADDVDAYVFVKMGAEGWTTSDNYTYTKGKMSFTVDSSKWTYLESGVYYTSVDAGAGLSDYPILAVNNSVTITVAADATKADIDTAATDATLVFTPYAIQQASFTDAATAWAAINK